jgi:hypothetical protein
MRGMTEDKSPHRFSALTMIAVFVVAASSYVGAFFALGEHGRTVDRNGMPMRVRIFSNHPWLCTIFRPMVDAESSLVEETTMCYRPPASDPIHQ